MYLILSIVNLFLMIAFLDNHLAAVCFLMAMIVFGICAIFDDYSGPGPQCMI
jgi:hypothetical protein